MSLLEQLKEAICNGSCPPIFNASDLASAGISDAGRNLSNYDKKNGGTDHEKALVSRKIGGNVFYTFDQEILPKLPPKNALRCEENAEGVRYYYRN